VPSSGTTADCLVTVEEAHTINFEYTTVNMYPGEQKVINYTVNPTSDYAGILWTVSDSSIIQVVSDNHAGRLTIIGKWKEGTGTIAGKTLSQSTSSFIVKNDFGNSFAVNKTSITTVPLNRNDGALDVDFEVSPPCAQIEVSGLPTNLSLVGGTYGLVSGVGTSRVFTITSAYFTAIDQVTNVAKGKIRFSVSGEVNSTVQVVARNPQGRSQVDGSLVEVQVGTTKSVTIKAYYSDYHINFGMFTGYLSSQGSEANPQVYHMRCSDGIIFLGDGERMLVQFWTDEGVIPLNFALAFEASGTDTLSTTLRNDFEAGHFYTWNQYAQPRSDSNMFIDLYHWTDYGYLMEWGGTGGRKSYYTLTSLGTLIETNTDVPPLLGSGVIYTKQIGTIKCTYQTFTGTTKTLSYPVFIEVRYRED
jgi:hypothetical protein